VADQVLIYLSAVFLFYLFVVQIYAIWPFTIDDMYISLRYAKHWSAGYGLVWNIGEPPVEGYSNFIFVVIGRLALSLGCDPVFFLKSTGVLGLFLTSCAVYALARFWFVTTLALIPCIWLLADKGQVLWGVSGLETTVYQALLCWAVFFIFRGLGYSFHTPEKECVSERELTDDERRPMSFVTAGVLLALAGASRPEAPVLMVLFAVLLILNRPKRPCPRYMKSGIFFCCTLLLCFVPYFLWRWHYYGRVFPNPVYCKGLTNPMTFVLDKDYLLLIWPFALLALPASSQPNDPRPYFLWLPSVVYLALLIGADPIVAFDHRLFLPAFALLLPLALVGVSRLYTRYFQQEEIDSFVVYLGGLLIAFFFIPMMTVGEYRDFTEHPLAGERLRQRVVSWLQIHTAPGSQVVLADSGFIPYHSQYQFIDSYCLNNLEMTNTPRLLMYQHFCDDMLKKEPDVIILTGLVEQGRTTYPPADACLAKRLIHSQRYCKQKSFETGDRGSFYRYEIFNKASLGCSKISHR
jgi:hypothetical protein